jgi:glycosyltransferase involved in cell wall biosynthesis
LLYSSRNTTELAANILQAAESRRLAVSARETIVERFDAEAGADAYAALYHRLAF